MHKYQCRNKNVKIPTNVSPSKPTNPIIITLTKNVMSEFPDNEFKRMIIAMIKNSKKIKR